MGQNMQLAEEILKRQDAIFEGLDGVSSLSADVEA